MCLKVELSIDSSSNRHFHNLATWYGRKYYETSISNEVTPFQISSVQNIVRAAIRDLDIQTY